MKKVKETSKNLEKKNIITNAFFKLLSQKRLVSRISIKEITDLAHINRSTFYSYFKNINEILDYWANDVYVTLDNIELEPNKQSIKNYFTFIFNIIDNNEQRLRNMLASDDFSFMCLKFIKHIRKRIDQLSINERVKTKLHILIEGYFIELISDFKHKVVGNVDTLRDIAFEVLDKILNEIKII